MKKRILALAMTLTMMLSIAACGSKPVDRNDSDNRTDDTKTEESLEETTSQDEEEGSALAVWYNSDDRKTLEDTISGMFESQGLTFFVEIEEPDTIIYNYKYTEQLDLEGLTQDDINANFDASMDDVAATVISDIGRYQSTYGIPLTTIRVIYLNADDSVVYSKDITEDYESSSASDEGSSSAAAYDSLQAWVDSEEAAMAIQESNDVLASSGMTVNISADGNVLVYEYYLSDDLGISELPEDQMEASFESTVESQKASITSLFENFESLYGLKLEAIRYSYFTEGGEELYSTDITNE